MQLYSKPEAYYSSDFSTMPKYIYFMLLEEYQTPVFIHFNQQLCQSWNNANMFYNEGLL